MTTTQLSCFKCLVEEGSVTKAAQRLCVTQPAVSQQLRLLTESLGCRLYHRRGQRIELTADGEFVYGKAKGILSELEGLPQELRSRGRRVIGKVRIGSGQVAAKTVVGDTIHDMSERYRDVSFSLFETNSSKLPELLLKSQIDLGVGILPHSRDGIRFEQLLKGRLLLICSQKSPLSSREIISRRELRKLNLIRHSKETTARAIAFELYGEGGSEANFRLEAMNAETIIAYVRRNMGEALATSHTIDWLKPHGIATVELEDTVQIPWGVMSDASRPMSKAAKAFVDRLTAQFS
ncbi:MAG: LysR family transcriptional regulator [Lentisphaerae bacterium]|jgi:DNA-binding transcriptional LysR family regulator|nr:LysR family transcriptional regulator [Lentisphaerota bacterium]MBT4821005.1 LysR family transcriptional regulator [Lentisphaerota bacterium]MBT5611375.1 LysR family transcriptional regulator [Lentisphaerota bacterium]MBT7062314.1 LysR family transcriptional regulator [Lentisphaerota bacterium]MBT7842280.1 LysR family transcriptional regulator [Lentisphaerota bacterium]